MKLTLDQQRRLKKRIEEWNLNESKLSDMNKCVLALCAGDMDGAGWKKLYEKG